MINNQPSPGTIQIVVTEEQLSKTIAKTISDQFEIIKNMLNQPPDQLLTREQAAELLQIDLSTLWGWTRKGKLPSYSMGNRVYYKRSEIFQSITKIKPII